MFSSTVVLFSVLFISATHVDARSIFANPCPRTICLVDPCAGSTCPAYPSAVCTADCNCASEWISGREVINSNDCGVPDTPLGKATGEDCSNMVAYAELKCADDPTTTCVELRGPVLELASKSIPVLITAPHGGQLKPDDDYADRDCAGNGWVCGADSYTLQLAEHVATRFGQQYGGKCPWMVINHLHRSKLDANRELPEAADGDANAEDAWVAFHSFITQAQEKINSIHGNDGNGIKGVMLDLHGYAGEDYLAGGAPYAMYGYRLTENTLLQDPLPDAPTGSITHAAQKLGPGGLENLVRGAKSLGALVPTLNPANVKGSMPANCGDPMPSPAIKSPISACPLNPPTLCNYFSGGYDLREHEKDVVNGNLDMNAIQVEVPRCIRKASNWYNGINAADDVAIWDDFGDKISSGLCAWIDGVFGGPPSC
eukprot:m.171827 g.171827  ORF g.171827 m.171827 type:complete len:428 (+) comp31663_c0_seq2:380-1663(+)